MEDLDRVTSSPRHVEAQLSDLGALGIDWDGEVIVQSNRFDLYREAIDELRRLGNVYECFCTRREIRQAASAPNGTEAADGRYPGTCRRLSAARRGELVELGRPPALRLRSDDLEITVPDSFARGITGVADDVVLQRNDGVPAYHVAVVVDDAAQGITEVVRGDDLLASTPSQIALQRLLGLPTPTYAHVPLVLGPDGTRLAKRHGSVTLADLVGAGQSVGDVVTLLARNLGLDSSEAATSAADLLDAFDWSRLPHRPWQFDPAQL